MTIWIDLFSLFCLLRYRPRFAGVEQEDLKIAKIASTYGVGNASAEVISDLLGKFKVWWLGLPQLKRDY